MKPFISPSQHEIAVIRNLWLHYFNDVLLDKAEITPEEHSKMSAKINMIYKIQDRPAFQN